MIKPLSLAFGFGHNERSQRFLIGCNRVSATIRIDGECGHDVSIQM